MKPREHHHQVRLDGALYERVDRFRRAWIKAHANAPLSIKAAVTILINRGLADSKVNKDSWE